MPTRRTILKSAIGALLAPLAKLVPAVSAASAADATITALIPATTALPDCELVDLERLLADIFGRKIIEHFESTCIHGTAAPTGLLSGY